EDLLSMHQPSPIRMPWPLPVEYEIKGKGDVNTSAVQIETTDHEFDRLVYELYSLTTDEIKIVEGESSNLA
ncbi:MAG: hypothetical protein WCG34_10030, partial [Leptolinea sp.]